MKAGGFLDFAVELKKFGFSALAESAGILGWESGNCAGSATDVK